MMAKNWIKKATANSHGQFKAKAVAAGKSTAAFAKAHEHDSGTTGKQARLAENLMGLNHKKSASETLYPTKEKK
jgi:hypothetical protein